MTLSVTDTINLFKAEVQERYASIKTLQKALFKYASPSQDESLSSARCLTIFSRSELFALFLDAIAYVEFADTEDLSSFSEIQDILTPFAKYEATLRNALGESKEFLPSETVRILESFSTPESILNQFNVAVFLILSVNTQEQ